MMISDIAWGVLLGLWLGCILGYFIACLAREAAD